MNKINGTHFITIWDILNITAQSKIMDINNRAQNLTHSMDMHFCGAIPIAVWFIKPSMGTIGERMATRGLIYNYKTDTYTDPMDIIS